MTLKFRPIAPKPPAGTNLSSADLDRAGFRPTMMKIRRGRRRSKRTTAAVKKETGAVASPPPQPKTTTTMAWVAVERVTAVGRCAASGEEIKRRLVAEASPCFVSDCTDSITWVNAAFCKILLCESSPSSPTAPGRMELLTRGMVPGGESGWFTCVTRVRMGTVVMVVACDVWRVDEEGNWAWRLDVATALGLGLGCG